MAERTADIERGRDAARREFEDVRIDVVRTTARSPSIGAFLARSGFFDRRTAAELTHLLRALESRADEHGLHLGSETIVGRARRV